MAHLCVSEWVFAGHSFAFWTHDDILAAVTAASARYVNVLIDVTHKRNGMFNSEVWLEGHNNRPTTCNVRTRVTYPDPEHCSPA